MKRNIAKNAFLLVLGCMAGLSSCSEESPWGGSETTGKVNLSLSTDAGVLRKTRADDTVSPVVPSGESFSVKLVKDDNSYSKTWSTVDGFNREKEFPIGDYSIEALYGDVNVEGFDNPAYRGVNTLHVSPGATTNVQVKATLANAMVSVRYTDDFNALYPDHSAAVQTAGHEAVAFARNETRPAYIMPGNNVAFKVTVTQDGKAVTLKPAEFNAEARHHYVITVGVTGNAATNDLTLNVVFDEDVVTEVVDVPLGDEIFSAPAPEVRAKNFTASTAMDTYEYALVNPAPQFHVFAYGGIKEVKLNVISDYSPLFGKSVQLVNAEPLTQQQLEREGVDASGFYRNVQKMGVVDVAGFIANLPAGSHKVEVQAVDALTRTSEPVELLVNVTATEFSVSAPSEATFMSEEAVVEVATNNAGIRDNVKFYLPGRVEAKVKSVAPVTASSGKASRADLPVKFRYVLETPKLYSASEIEAVLGNNKKVCKFNLGVKAPEFTIAVDAFADHALLRVDATDPVLKEYIFKYAKFQNAGQQVSDANLVHDSKTGLITMRGLVAGTKYLAVKAVVNGFEYLLPEFTTENDTDLPNGSFAETTRTISLQKIPVGGKWHPTLLKSYQNYSSIERSEANGWASLNQFTCYVGSANKNTWFLVPSTFVENGECVVRTVGYHHNGTDIKESGTAGELPYKYYCTNSPAALNVSRGELFLGSYSFDGSEHRTDGISWTSRPMSLSFDYRYTSYKGEKGEFFMKIVDAEGIVIAEQRLDLTVVSSMTSKTVEFTNYPFGKKASRIELVFRSTKAGVEPQIYIPTGGELDDGGGLKDNTFAANQYKAFAKGSELVVDNVRLNYGVANAAAKRNRR